MAKKPRLTVADTMDFYIRHTPAPLAELLRQIDGLILNDSEARLLTGRQNTIAAAREILRMGRRSHRQKGENGAFYLSNDAIRLIPAFLRKSDRSDGRRLFRRGADGVLAAAGKSDPESIVADMARATIIASYNVEGFLA